MVRRPHLAADEASRLPMPGDLQGERTSAVEALPRRIFPDALGSSVRAVGEHETRGWRRRFRRQQPAAEPALRRGWLDAAALAEGGLLADVGIVLDLAAIYLPLIGTVLEPAIPTPFAILMLRRGTKATLLAAAVMTFLVTVIAGPHFGWRAGLRALVGLLLGWCMRRRLRAPVVIVAGVAVVTTAAVAAAFVLIAATGLPIKDITDELRNGLGAAAWVLATGASLLGRDADWLSVRPLLVAIGLLALRFWPVLLYLYVALFSLPVVTLYYAIANGAARVLGHNVRVFPPHWAVELTRYSLLVLVAPIVYPFRALRWAFGLPGHLLQCRRRKASVR
ncbi:MAG TPA: DUF2232 domain-containing protein [Ktedonobacterales bacterium]|nr:DUF2232 domain-containing protein [Ktedonobacterales bacterium]